MVLEEPFTVEDYAICISKDNPDLTKAFNEAIAEIKSNGTLEAILDKYINQTEGAKGYVTPEGTDTSKGTLVMAEPITLEESQVLEAAYEVASEAALAGK